MAREIRHFTVTVPAGTLSSAPAVIPVTFPVRVVRQIDWQVPNGPMGQLGWRLTMGGVQVLPYNSDPWMIKDGQHGSWPLTDAPDGGTWQLTGYNTGRFPHNVHLAFHLDAIIQAPPQVRLTPAWMLGNAPDLAGLLPAGPKRR